MVIELDDIERTVSVKHLPTRKRVGREDTMPAPKGLHTATSVSDEAKRFHERTKNRPSVDVGADPEFHTLEMLFAQVNARSDYSGHEPIQLPEPDELTEPLGRGLGNRRSRRRFTREDVSLKDIANLLAPAAGVTKRIDREVDGLPFEYRYRAYPSGGALYPVEVYVCVLRGDDVDAGLYYYAPESNVLRVLRRDEDVPRRLPECFAVESVDVADASLVVVLTTSFWRTTAKYGSRGYRNALQESGHLAQNIQLVATARSLGCLPVSAFYDDRLGDLIGLDGRDEDVVYTLLVGTQGDDERR